MLSLVIPVYNNFESLTRLLSELEALSPRVPDDFEVVFVVDGATDGSRESLERSLPVWPLKAQLIVLSRNFGSFAAIAAGLQQARGEYMAVIAADLQEPPELVLDFHRLLTSGDIDVVVGVRASRADEGASPWLSRLFWRLYRRLVIPDMPAGGVDVFGCTRAVRDQLVRLRESNTNLVALLFWLGFRRAQVPYARRARLEGRSGWTFQKKLRYAVDSVFNFTDLPLRALMAIGILGTSFAAVLGVTVFVMWALGHIPVLGYTPLMLVVMFFGALTALGFGIVGQYLWLTLQNARARPAFVIQSASAFDPPRATHDRNSS